MARYFVIFNPAARGEKSQRLRALLESKAGLDVALAPTTCAGDATRLAAQGVAQGAEVIVAAGGDGTINEVLNGLGPAGVTLGVLPLGTVNVFAREFGIPLRLEAAWSALATGKVRALDLPFAEIGNQRRYFAQLAGVGFDAHVVRAASWELKKRIGPLSYVWAGLQALHRPHPCIEVTGDNGQRARGVAVFIGNGRYYGGSFRLFPQARFDDGQLDVCVFDSTGYFSLLRYGFGILSGRHPRLRGVSYLQAASFTCTPTEPGQAAVELDGEDAGSTPARFGLLPGALRVVLPEKR